MKKLILLILPILFIVVSCNNTEEAKEKRIANPEQTVELQIAVEGMTCSGCENHVNTELLKLDGVTDAKASHVDKNVIILVDTTMSSVKVLEDCISEVGYKVIYQ